MGAAAGYSPGVLNPTPIERLLDTRGRPYFLWDCDLTDSQFRTLLRSDDPALRAALIGKLMRQAKPDDVFAYTSEAEIRALWSQILPHLGNKRAFWVWLFDSWAASDAE